LPVETRYATQLLAESSVGVGYLLKDRVADVGDFLAGTLIRRLIPAMFATSPCGLGSPS
jgi:hypothetical protein